jgi:hypothetical protein
MKERNENIVYVKNYEVSFTLRGVVLVPARRAGVRRVRRVRGIRRLGDANSPYSLATLADRLGLGLCTLLRTRRKGLFKGLLLLLLLVLPRTPPRTRRGLLCTRLGLCLRASYNSSSIDSHWRLVACLENRSKNSAFSRGEIPIDSPSGPITSVSLSLICGSNTSSILHDLRAWLHRPYDAHARPLFRLLCSQALCEWLEVPSGSSTRFSIAAMLTLPPANIFAMLLHTNSPIS